MKADYLHNHKEFLDLIKILADEMQINPQLVEKDYWIMHVLYGLQKQHFEFELKGGTSLSKGYKIIDRFSEDIDIHIKPSSNDVETNPKKTKPNQIESRKKYYNWLTEKIQIDGIEKIIRDESFDDPKYYRSGGIRLFFKSFLEPAKGLKEGIVLEVGFDTVTPNKPLTITSWAYEKAANVKEVKIEDNRAIDVLCYDPGHSLVEKLQTIATKFRIEQNSGIERPNLLRQYYDVYCLLGNEEVRKFIGSKEYLDHKSERFPKTDFDIPVNKNEAFMMSDKKLRQRFIERYKKTSNLYYNGQLDFEVLLSRIHENFDKM